MSKRILAASAAVLVVTAVGAPAFAHPAFSPREVDKGAQAVEVTLQVPHGCTNGEPPPQPGEEVLPTNEIALEVPDGVTIDSVAEVEGWSHAIDEGEPVVITWTADDGEGTTDLIELPFVASFPDRDLALGWKVFQACTEGNYRWIGGSDDALPPANLVVGDADAASHGEHGEEMAEGDHGEEMAEGDHGEEMAEGEHGDEMAEGEHGDGEHDGMRMSDLGANALDVGDAELASAWPRTVGIVLAVLAVLLVGSGLFVRTKPE